MNCEQCRTHIQPEEAVMVIPKERDGSELPAVMFCSHHCAGSWAIGKKRVLRHIGFFACSPAEVNRG